jgi:hypothetical protein
LQNAPAAELIAEPLIRKNHPMRMQLSMFSHHLLSADY